MYKYVSFTEHMSALTSVRVYAVLIAILCETVRALQIWPSSVSALLWLIDVHWSVTTPLIISTLVPTISIAAISSIISGVLTLILGLLTTLSAIVSVRCGLACLSTVPVDVARIGLLGVAAWLSFLLTVDWWSVEPQKEVGWRRSLIVLTLLGIVPTVVLAFSSWGVLALPALAIDPALLWVTILDRRQTYSIAFGAVILLVVFDVLHCVLFHDSEYFFNVLVLRTIIDVGRLYMRLGTI